MRNTGEKFAKYLLEVRGVGEKVCVERKPAAIGYKRLVLHVDEVRSLGSRVGPDRVGFRLQCEVLYMVMAKPAHGIPPNQ